MKPSKDAKKEAAAAKKKSKGDKTDPLKFDPKSMKEVDVKVFGVEVVVEDNDANGKTADRSIDDDNVRCVRQLVLQVHG